MGKGPLELKSLPRVRTELLVASRARVKGVGVKGRD